MGNEHKMEIIDLMVYLRNQLLIRLDKEGMEDNEGLRKLGAALLELSLAAEHYQDRMLCNLIDDMIYVVQETSMGSRAKGESALLDIDAAIKVLESNR